MKLRKKSYFTLLIAALAILGTSLTGHAVTDKEMEQARTITAKYYLRWANNGSGYLDDINVTTMSELKSKCKSAELENLKTFEAVSVPTDYAGWDKEKLAKYWTETFFASPGLLEAGKGGRHSARKRIMAMEVSAPQPKEAEPTPEEAVAAPDAQPSASTESVAEQSDEEILADQTDIQKAAEEADPPIKEKGGNTWIYIVVLGLLVAVVIWLVVYAANLMKRQPGGNGDPRHSEEASAEAKAKIEDLRRRLENEENRSAELGAELERMKLEKARANEQIDKLREENRNLRLQRTTVAAPAPAREERTEIRRPAAAPAPTPRPAQKEIYLGRANAQGIFVRADRRFNPGNSIYRLTTPDGLVGTFSVVDHPDVVETVIYNPREFLAYGCTAEDIDDTEGVSRIVTESAGTAIFENGYWKVLRKSVISYE